MSFLSSEKLIVGYDLGNKYSQISFAVSESGEVETLSLVAGAQVYNIPTVLCKRYGVNQWLYGGAAVRCAEAQEGILIENLLELALSGEPVLIEGESYNPVALLALFFKRSLGLLARVGSPEKMTALMITCSELDGRVLEVLGQMVDGIHMKADRVSFQSHTESFYNYMIHQPQELWGHQTVLFYYGEKAIKTYRMECNRRAKPIVAFVEEGEYQLPMGEDPDSAFCRIAEEVCGERLISSVFLIGDGFVGNWMNHSLRYLCKGRRVFQGNNLFGKGACYGMQERLMMSEVGKEYVFLGQDKLKANVGMKILRNGAESYYALLDAGVNWYEAEHTMELYLQEGAALSISITPLIVRRSKLARIGLDQFPGNIARLKVHLYMKSESELVVEIEDLGFGEIYPATGRVWKETVDLYQ